MIVRTGQKYRATKSFTLENPRRFHTLELTVGQVIEIGNQEKFFDRDTFNLVNGYTRISVTEIVKNCRLGLLELVHDMEHESELSKKTSKLDGIE